MIDTTQLIIYNIYITLDYATYMIMLSYDFLQKTYTPISIGFFAFYTAILAFLYPQIIGTKTFLKQHSSEYLLNKFKEKKVVEYFLHITIALLLCSLFLIVFKCPFLLFVLSLATFLELLFLCYPSLRIMERYTFEKEKVYEEEFEKLYSDDFKMLKQIIDEADEIQQVVFLKDIKQKSFKQHFLLLSSCQTDICNNLDDFETNSKLVDLIIKDWHKWIEFAIKHRLSWSYCNNYYNKNVQEREQKILEQLKKSTSGFLKNINLHLEYLCYIISGDKTNLLFSYIVNRLNFDFEKNNTFKIGDKEYEIIDPYLDYFYYIFNLFYKFIDYDNSTNYHIELALEKELPGFYIKYCEYSYKNKEKRYNHDTEFLKDIALRIIRKRHEDVNIIDKFFFALKIAHFSFGTNKELEKEQTIVNYRIVMQILSYYMVRNNYEIFGNIESKGLLFARSDFIPSIVQLFFVIQRYRSDKFDNDSNNYEYEKYYILFWLLCGNKHYYARSVQEHNNNNDNDSDRVNFEKIYKQEIQPSIKKCAQQNYKDIHNTYCWPILNTETKTTYTNFLDYLIEKFFSNSLLINGLFRNKQNVLDDIRQKQDDYKKYIKSVILTIAETIDEENKNEILTKIIIAYYLAINSYLLYLLLQKQSTI